MNETIRRSRLSIASFLLAILPLILILGFMGLYWLGVGSGELPLEFSRNCIGGSVFLFIVITAPVVAMGLGIWAVFRIAGSSGMLTGRSRAYLAILFAGLQVAFIIVLGPHFVQQRENSRQALCRSHLRQIQRAKEILAEDRGASNGQAVTWQNLVGAAGIDKKLSCPSGGHYTVNVIGLYPRCSIATHQKCWETYISERERGR